MLQLAAPTPAQVAATPSEVALVLDNLIGNALRFARSVVRVAVLPAGQWVRLIVEDDGPGIPEDDRRRVFDRFVRVAPEVGGGGGAGLGLALVAALVQARGGTATAGAAPSGGARIEVRWRTPDPRPHPAQPHRRANGTLARLGGARVPFATWRGCGGQVVGAGRASPRLRRSHSASTSGAVGRVVRLPTTYTSRPAASPT